MLTVICANIPFLDYFVSQDRGTFCAGSWYDSIKSLLLNYLLLSILCVWSFETEARTISRISLKLTTSQVLGLQDSVFTSSFLTARAVHH